MRSWTPSLDSSYPQSLPNLHDPSLPPSALCPACCSQLRCDQRRGHRSPRGGECSAAGRQEAEAVGTGVQCRVRTISTMHACIYSYLYTHAMHACPTAQWLCGGSITLHHIISCHHHSAQPYIICSSTLCSSTLPLALPNCPRTCSNCHSAPSYSPELATPEPWTGSPPPLSARSSK